MFRMNRVDAILLGTALLIALYIYIKSTKHEKTQLILSERERRKTLDRQDNIGRQIFNWLGRELWVYRDNVFLTHNAVDPVVEGQGKFPPLSSIYIIDKSTKDCFQILQIDFDFLGDRKWGHNAHIHYGAYGPDIYFDVVDHAATFGLDRHVLREVADYVASLSATPKATS